MRFARQTTLEFAAMESRLPDELELDEGAPRRAPLRAIALLPAAATLGNFLCGVFALVCCLLSIRANYLHGAAETVSNPRWAELIPTYLSAGGYLIMLAMICDALDGRLARLTRRTGEFGAQFDSIADVVSFGVAPVALYLTLLLRLAVPSTGAALVSPLEWRIGLLCALVYASCSAIRLARYNAENVQGEAAQKRFTGMPVPGAAAAFVSLLILHEDLAHGGIALGGWNWPVWLRWGLAPLTFLLGMLMVSRIEHIHIFNQYVRREQPLTHLVWLVIIIALGWWWPAVLLVTLSMLYVVSGVALNVMRRGQRPSAAAASESIRSN